MLCIMHAYKSLPIRIYSYMRICIHACNVCVYVCTQALIPTCVCFQESCKTCIQHLLGSSKSKAVLGVGLLIVKTEDLQAIQRESMLHEQDPKETEKDIALFTHDDVYLQTEVKFNTQSVRGRP